MNDFKKLNNKLIICSDIYRSIFINIKKDDPTLNFKIMSEREVIERLSFSYDSKALVEIIHKKHVSFKSAKEILNVLRIIDENNDFDNLLELKNWLYENKLLNTEEYQKIMFKRNDIILFEEENNQELQTFLTKNNVNFKFESLKSLNIEGEINKSFIKYKDRYNQFDVICNEICKLLTQDKNNENEIAIRANYQDLRLYFTTFEKLYNLKFYYKDQRNILTFPIIQKLVKKIFNNKCFDIEKPNLANEYVRTLINLIDTYRLKELDFEFAYNLLIELLSKANEKISSDKGILVTSDFECSKRKYTFELDFDFNNYPRVYSDDGYYSDVILNNLGLNPSYIKTKIDDQNKKSFIYYSNVFLSYPIVTFKEDAFPSSYIDEFEMKGFEYNSCKIQEYSKDSSKIDYKIFRKYFAKSAYFPRIQDIYKDKITLDETYDWTFKKFTLKDYKLTNSSYTKTNEYYQCPFKYYCSRILGLDEYKGSTAADVGTFAHSVLEKVYFKNFDFDVAFNNSLKALSSRFTPSEILIFKKVTRPRLLDLCQYIRSKSTHANIKQTYSEKKFYFDIDNVTYESAIDSILETTDKSGKDYLTLIDYKTGKYYVSDKYFEKGLGLQLPLYAIAVRNDENFKNAAIRGLFIMPILKAPSGTTNSCSNDLVRKESKYDGMAVGELSYLLSLDDQSTEKGSQYIKNNKLVSEEAFEKRITEAMDFIKEYIKNENAGNFEINPYKFDTGNESPCDNCDYRCICYRKLLTDHTGSEEDEDDENEAE